MKRVLLACPLGTLYRSDTGNAKDLKWLQELLAKHQWVVETIGFDPVTERLARIPPYRPEIAILFYSSYPIVARDLRAMCHRLYVRASNVEHWQARERFHNAEELKERQEKTLNIVDGVLAISEWEVESFWSSWHHNVIHLPYSTPLTYKRTSEFMPINWDDRERKVVVMPGRLDEPIGASQLEGAQRIEQNRARCLKCRESYSLVVSTGESNESFVNPTLQALPHQYFQNPFATIRSVRAVINPGNKGFGLKTTLVDAVLGNTHAFTSPMVHSRLPSYLKRYIRVIKNQSECCNIRETILYPPSSSDALSQFLEVTADSAIRQIT
jgi:hypothetical protein